MRPKLGIDFEKIHLVAYKLATGVTLSEDASTWPEGVADLIVFDMRYARKDMFGNQNNTAELAVAFLKRRQTYIEDLISIAKSIKA